MWHGSLSHTSMHLAPMAVACVPVGDAVASAAPAGIPAIGGELTLAHVIETLVPAGYPDLWAEAALASATSAEEREALRRQLEALVPREADSQGLTTQVEVLRLQKRSARGQTSSRSPSVSITPPLSSLSHRPARSCSLRWLRVTTATSSITESSRM